jgi:hypothetical protein
MKYIIGDKRYDTSNANLVLSDVDWRTFRGNLYVTPKGNFFLEHRDAFRDGQPLTAEVVPLDEARSLVVRFGGVDIAEGLFFIEDA